MKRLTLWYIVCLICTLSACKQKEVSDNSTTDAFCQENAWFKSLAKSENEEQLIMELSGQFISNTSLQAYVDHNDIIAFAIDEAIDFEKTPSGLFYKIITPGKEEKLDWGNKIKAHYKGYFLDGKLFDSSCRRGQPMEFYIGNMIDGWNEGLQLIGDGGKIMLAVPSRLGYGKEGLTGNAQELVPPNKVLLFEIAVKGKVK